MFDTDKPKYTVTDLVVRDLLDTQNANQLDSKRSEDLERGLPEKQLPLCTLCDTEWVDGKETPTDRILTSDLDFGMRLLFDYALVLDQDIETPKVLKVIGESTRIEKF
jgi:hypothetical protein